MSHLFSICSQFLKAITILYASKMSSLSPQSGHVLFLCCLLLYLASVKISLGNINQLIEQLPLIIQNFVESSIIFILVQNGGNRRIDLYDVQQVGNCDFTKILITFALFIQVVPSSVWEGLFKPSQKACRDSYRKASLVILFASDDVTSEVQLGWCFSPQHNHGDILNERHVQSWSVLYDCYVFHR